MSYNNNSPSAINKQKKSFAPASIAAGSCCAQLCVENQLLRRALRKEREKCQFITSAYKQLLKQYERLADLKTVMELSTLSSSSVPSSSSSAEEEKRKRPSRGIRAVFGRTSSIEGDKENMDNLQPNVVKHREKQNHDDGGQALRSPTSSRISTPVSGIPVRNNWYYVPMSDGIQHMVPQRQQKTKQKMRSPFSSRSSTPIPSENVLKGIDRENWYFVPWLNSKSHQDQAAVIDEEQNKMLRIRQLFAQSQQRCDAIRKASRERAQIAANRRAVAADLVTGRRALDGNALRVLFHSDSSRCVRAFPPDFMREQRAASRRCFHKSPIRQSQERERQRQFEGAVNRIMAHSSATMAKIIASKSRPDQNMIQFKN